MKKFMSKVFSWKTLGWTAGAGAIGIGAFNALSGLAAIGSMSTAFAAGLSTVLTVASGVGAIVAAVGLTAMAGKGLVNLGRLIFSKNYRKQLSAKRAKKREQKREKKQTNVKVKINIFTRIINFFRGKGKNKKDPQPLPPGPQPGPDPKDPEPKKKVTRKAGGMYDLLSEENKALYDSMIRKNAETTFLNMPIEQVQYFENLAASKVKHYQEKVKKGEELTLEEQQEVVKYSVLRTKAHNFIRKNLDVQSSDSFENEEEAKRAQEEVLRRAMETSKKKPSSGR